MRDQIDFLRMTIATKRIKTQNMEHTTQRKQETRKLIKRKNVKKTEKKGLDIKMSK